MEKRTQGNACGLGKGQSDRGIRPVKWSKKKNAARSVGKGELIRPSAEKDADSGGGDRGKGGCPEKKTIKNWNKSTRIGCGVGGKGTVNWGEGLLRN